MNRKRSILPALILLAALALPVVAGAEWRVYDGQEDIVMIENYVPTVSAVLFRGQAVWVTEKKGDQLFFDYYMADGRTGRGSHPEGGFRKPGQGEACIGIVNNKNPDDRLNLRVKPNRASMSRGRYYNGTVVIVYGVKNGWAHVKVDLYEGYMQADHLLLNERPGAVAPAFPTVTPKDRQIRLRGREMEGWYVGCCQPGETWNVLADLGGWLHVANERDSILGYVKRSEVKVVSGRIK